MSRLPHESPAANNQASPPVAAAGPPTVHVHSTSQVQVLSFTVDGFDQFYPLLPLARELQRLGHVVAFLAPATMQEAISAEGFDLVAQLQGRRAHHRSEIGWPIAGPADRRVDALSFRPSPE